MPKNIIPYLIITVQISSCIWYLLPSAEHAHIPGGFIKMLIFGGIALAILVINLIFYLTYKPKRITWKLPFIISITMLLLA